MSDQNPDITTLMFRLQEMESKIRELEQIKSDVKDIKELTSLGSDVASEIQKELVAEAEALKQNDIIIPFLEKQVEEITFKRRGGPGKGAKPLLESDILEVQKTTDSARRAARKLGVSYPTYKKYCKMYNIFKVKDKTLKRPNTSPVNPYKSKYPITKILQNQFPDFPIHRLKDKLIRAGIKKAECEQCGFSERRITDGKIPLLLNFEDSDRHNHKLENLKILCYNCTFVSGRGYIKRGTVHFNMDPDIMQGAKFPLKARF